MKLAVLISGTGRTLHNLLEREFDVRLVISNNSKALGNKYATEYDVPIYLVRRQDAEKPDDIIFKICEDNGIDMVCLAGWNRLIEVPPAWNYRVINIHPSLLPSFGGKGMHGKHVHEAVISHGCSVSGCTVHFVDYQYDHGVIIYQAPVPVMDYDDAGSLATRVFQAECEAYPWALRLLAGEWYIENRRFKTKPKP